jgi:hypothetical protein
LVAFKEVRDQAAHFTAAVVVLLPVILFPCFLTGALSGFGIGLVRELTEEGEISLNALHGALSSRLDLTFWALGGALAGLL